MEKTLTAKLLEETLAFLNETFRDSLGQADIGLAAAIHLLIGLLFIAPAVAIAGRWMRARFNREGRQEVTVCGHCREEIHEHAVRCPSCQIVFPSSFLRAVIAVGVLILAVWTARQRSQPPLFYGLMALYGAGALFVFACMASERVRGLAPARLGKRLVLAVTDASVRGREVWARAEAALRVLVVLVFYGGLLLGLHRYGLPAAGAGADLAAVLSKLTFLNLLLALTSMAVLAAQLRRFQGFSTLVLASGSLVLCLSGAVLTNTLGGFIKTEPGASEEHRVLAVEVLDGGRAVFEFRDPRGGMTREILTLKEPGELRFTCSLLVVERFAYRRYFLKELAIKESDGRGPVGPLARAESLDFWDLLTAPEQLIYPIYALALNEVKPEWMKSFQVAVDPQEPRQWRIPLEKGKKLQVYIDGVRILYRLEGEQEVRELEAF